MDSIIGILLLFIEASLCQAWDMEKENGKCCMGITIKANIWMIKKMAKGIIIGKMALNIMGILKMIIGMGMGKWYGMMGMYIKANGLMGYKKM